MKANYPLVFVGRREVAEVSTHWVTFDYQKVIIQMVDHLSGLCLQHSLVYVESFEQEREPRKDKRRFLLDAARSLGLEVLIVQADERNKISEKDFEIIEQSKVVFRPPVLSVRTASERKAPRWAPTCGCGAGGRLDGRPRALDAMVEPTVGTRFACRRVPVTVVAKTAGPAISYLHSVASGHLRELSVHRISRDRLQATYSMLASGAWSGDTAPLHRPAVPP